ncbi:hypothetical protein LCGC14_0388140 [marine sediment metagenome]|uniref:Uncharacterized protein n=1 Tax=marine sediment metagenome TaxID=412755 RepID=A0A0F9TI89_9ZZZZ
MGECVNQTGFSCTNDRCECHGITPEPMQSLEDIRKYEKGEILAVLKRGTIKRHTLLDALPFYISDRRMRDYVAELIKDGQCIQSSNDGYTLIESETQLAEAEKYLRSKAFPLFERANTLRKNFYKSEGKQLTFSEFLDNTTTI